MIYCNNCWTLAALAWPADPLATIDRIKHWVKSIQGSRLYPSGLAEVLKTSYRCERLWTFAVGIDTLDAVHYHLEVLTRLPNPGIKTGRGQSSMHMELGIHPCCMGGVRGGSP